MRVSKSGIIFACFLLRNKLQLNLNSGTIIIMIYMEIRWFVVFFSLCTKTKKKKIYSTPETECTSVSFCDFDDIVDGEETGT